MERFALIINSTPAGCADVYFGFSRFGGGLDNTAVFYTTAFLGIRPPIISLETTSPVLIKDGCPGLQGCRIFLDVMGSCVMSSKVDVDFKVYETRSSTQPYYQIQTTSMAVSGLTA